MRGAAASRGSTATASRGRLAAPFGLVLAAAIAGAGLGGCAARAPADTSPGRSIASAPAGDLMSRLAARRAALRGLRGTAKLRIVSAAAAEPGEDPTPISTSQAVLVEAPASFRLESLSPFGVSYVVASDGQELAVLVPDEGTVYRGAAGAATIGAATGVPAESFEVAALLLGLPPMPPVEESSAWVSTDGPAGAAAADDSASTLYLHVPSREAPGQTIVVGFAPADGAGNEPVPVLFERIERDGSVSLRARFAAFEPVGDVPVATEVTVEAPGSRAELRYREVALASSIDGASFVLPTPAGMRDAPLAGAPAPSGS